VTELTPAQNAQIAAFEAYRISHPKLMAADKEICDLIEHPTGAAAYLVIGPTGAGKTTLIERVVRSLHNGMVDELRADPGRYPALVIRTPAPAGMSLSWRDLFMRGLAELEEPEIDAKEPRSRAASASHAQFKSVDGARWAFEDAVRARRPKAVILDEGSHLTAVGTGLALSHQLDLIKSLSDATEAVFVIVGTYALVNFRNLSGQLGRRCRDVYLARYRFDVEDEAKVWRNVIHSFAGQLPIEHCDLVAEDEYLYEGSAGCVGILKQWLDRALVAAFLDHTAFDHAQLVKTRLPTQALVQIASEIAQGERAVAETDEDRHDLRALLGLEAPLPATFERQSARSVKSRRRVGKRNPTSDPIGVAWAS
jgi:hypothetical protein